MTLPILIEPILNGFRASMILRDFDSFRPPFIRPVILKNNQSPGWLLAIFLGFTVVLY